MTSAVTPLKLWEHPNPKSTNMAKFMRALEKEAEQSFDNFYALHKYSVQQRTHFWDFLFRYSNLIFEGSYRQAVDERARMDSIPRWFEGVRINFAENLLLSQDGSSYRKEDEMVAITEVNEMGLDSTTHWTWKDLRERTGRLVQALKANNVRQGDRIAAVSGNNLNTLVVFLATTALGAIFSSTSTDMGVGGVLDRLRQIKPRWVFMDDSALYNGKIINLRGKMQGVIHGIEGVDEFQGIVSMPRNGAEAEDVSDMLKTRTLDSFLRAATGTQLVFTRVAFSDPFLIVYSSGTTGAPKCIVHSVGGVLLNAYKENALHQEVGPGSVTMQYTTTNWIMYLAQVQNLQLGCRLVLFDGSPFLPERTILLQISQREGVTHMGISPRYIHELQSARISPRDKFDLTKLQVVTSTGMVLPDNLFDWFYEQGFPKHTRLNNMSGGTDLAGCFGIGNPLVPVYKGGCSGLGLGMAVEVYDSGVQLDHSTGQRVKDGVPGELVCTVGFPNQPAMFWGPDGSSRYHNAYFAKFDNVWTQGDFVAVHPDTRQLLFFGRSDGVLNPSGVRFGSSEIYKIIETEFSSEIADSICVGQKRPSDGNERVFLFLLMRDGVPYTMQLVNRVKGAIRKGLSARHVPSYIFSTPEIPTTVNLKKVELPVKRIISGDKITPSGTLLNPKSLEYYYQFAEVECLKDPLSKL